MVTTMMRGLLVSTFLVVAVPAMADDVMPATMGTTTMGAALVDTKGMALYTLDADVGGKSTCNGDCAAQWIPLPVADGATPLKDWSVVVRDDGTRMWAYKGQPVYTFVEDKAAGDVMGDGKAGFHVAGLSDKDRAAFVMASFAVATMGTTTMGPAWVDSHGMALYTFEKDAGGKSMCNGDCATEWPPLMVADGGAAQGDWTIVVRDDGSKMWAYQGHPLYTFVDDKAPGEVTGDKKDGFHLAM
jgi:predicted lipoprotein with Yx(FWY)xxD motif